MQIQIKFKTVTKTSNQKRLLPSLVILYDNNRKCQSILKRKKWDNFSQIELKEKLLCKSTFINSKTKKLLRLIQRINRFKGAFRVELMFSMVLRNLSTLSPMARITLSSLEIHYSSMQDKIFNSQFPGLFLSNLFKPPKSLTPKQLRLIPSKVISLDRKKS